MKYEVCYLLPQKKKYVKETATFFKIDDAIFWESIVKEKGAKDVIICPK